MTKAHYYWRVGLMGVSVYMRDTDGNVTMVDHKKSLIAAEKVVKRLQAAEDKAAKKNQSDSPPECQSAT